MVKRRAIFLDRDGVINANRADHVKSWDEFVFLPGVLHALRQLAASDFVVVVTTNQAAIGRGLTQEAAVRDIHERMTHVIERAGGRIDAVYFCPHRPEDTCACRKPKPGLYMQGVEQWDIDLARSYVIGDALADVTAALSIGAQPILVLTGRGCEQQQRLIEGGHSGYHVAQDLPSAVAWIWQKEKIAP